jgi:hypothetical protein
MATGKSARKSPRKTALRSVCAVRRRRTQGMPLTYQNGGVVVNSGSYECQRVLFPGNVAFASDISVVYL